MKRTFLLMLILPTLIANAQSRKIKDFISKSDSMQFIMAFDNLPDTIDYNQWDIITDYINDHEGGEFDITPAKFAQIIEPILVKESYQGYKKPIYKTVNDTIMLVEGYDKITISPTIYEKVLKIELWPASDAWVKRRDYTGRFDPKCFNEQYKIDTCLWQMAYRNPRLVGTASYRYVNRNHELVVKSIPPKYVTIKVKKIDWEATAKRKAGKKYLIILPEYIKVTKTYLEIPPKFREIEIHPGFSTKDEKKLIKTGRFGDDIPYYGINPPYFED